MDERAGLVTVRCRHQRRLESEGQCKHPGPFKVPSNGQRSRAPEMGQPTHVTQPILTARFSTVWPIRKACSLMTAHG